MAFQMFLQSICLRCFHKIQEALIHCHKNSKLLAAVQDFFQKRLFYQKACGIVGIAQENNVHIRGQRLEKAFIQGKLFCLFQRKIFHLTVHAVQRLLILCKGGSRHQGFLWIYRPAKGKDHLCCAVSADYLLRFGVFVFCNGFFEGSAANLGIVTDVIQAFYNGFFDSLRGAKGIAVC